METLIYSVPHKANFEANIVGDVNINLNKIRDPSVRRYKDFLKRNILIKDGCLFSVILVQDLDTHAHINRTN